MNQTSERTPKQAEMRVLFIVQGEGRGHMTQALAMEQILVEAGHDVSGILIGTSSRREIPDYFKAKTKATLYTVLSPNFYYDKDSKAINLWKTGVFNILAIPRFLGELWKIHRIVGEKQPEVIINFYDLLGGYYFALFNPRVKRISIAHQYLAGHKQFPFAKSKGLQKALFRLTNWCTSMNSHSRIALSFRDYPKEQKRMVVAPPLLRDELFELKPEKGDYLLAYVVNPGYAQEIMNWHGKNKKVKIHCFWDNPEGDGWSPWPGLQFHYINDQKFLQMMAGCIGYISTAGFESICEAMYLKKPVMMVPVTNQYEQACNALDAANAGAGIWSEQFDIGRFLHYLSQRNSTTDEFRIWLSLYKTIILKEVESFVPNTRPQWFKNNNRALLKFVISSK